jgi:hypothetical protein
MYPFLRIGRRKFLRDSALGLGVAPLISSSRASAQAEQKPGGPAPISTAPGAQELRSGANRLAVEASTGRIQLLTVGNRNLVERPHRGPIRLHAPLPDFEAHIIEAFETRPNIESGENELVITHPRLNGKRGPMNISATINISSLHDGGFALQATVDNHSDVEIPQVFFPWISGLSPVDGPDDQVTFGKSRFRPWREWTALRDSQEPMFMKYLARPEFEVSYPDPYQTGMKWMDFGGRDLGVSLFSKDTGARVQWLEVSAETYHPSTIDLAWYLYPFIRPGQSWSSAVYVLYPHQGDWHYGVLKYKEFADRAFVPVPSSPDLDQTLGQFTLWISWHYQDWRDLRYTFKDIPAIAAEARRAGFREMTLSRATALDFRLPPVIREPLGTDQDLKDAVQQARQEGVNIIPFFTCHIIRPDTIPEGQDKEEWFVENVAGQKLADNWSYDPTMTPIMPIRQIGSRAGYYACPGSVNWRRSFGETVKLLEGKWDYHGFMFDQSSPGGDLCFNPRHTHPPDAMGDLLADVLQTSRRDLGNRFPDAVVSGESQWDHATQWMDLTWEWTEFRSDSEGMAPFHMAFPRAHFCAKTSGKRSLINRIFVSGYLLDMYLEDGGGRMGAYPELSSYLATLAAFKKQFLVFFSQRDAYLHNMFVKVQPDQNAWVRVHRSGNEALVLATTADGSEADFDLALDVQNILGHPARSLTVWSRELASLTTTDQARLRVHVPREDFVGIHVR